MGSCVWTWTTWASCFTSDWDALGTLSRMSTLSETLRLFFEAWVPELCRQHNRSTERADRVYLIYAGGDDLFVVGAWSALPDLAQQIRKDFHRFVGGNHVTLSGGIAIERAKYPLYQLAKDAQHALDDQAKEFQRPGGRSKDALSFLGKPMAWDRFKDVAKWKDDLLEALRGDHSLPHAFLTRLCEVHKVYSDNAALQRQLHRHRQFTHEEIRQLIQYDRWQWRLVYQWVVSGKAIRILRT